MSLQNISQHSNVIRPPYSQMEINAWASLQPNARAAVRTPANAKIATAGGPTVRYNKATFAKIAFTTRVMAERGVQTPLPARAVKAPKSVAQVVRHDATATRGKEQQAQTRAKEQQAQTRAKEQQSQTRTKEQQAHTRAKEQKGQARVKEQKSLTTTADVVSNVPESLTLTRPAVVAVRAAANALKGRSRYGSPSYRPRRPSVTGRRRPCSPQLKIWEGELDVSRPRDDDKDNPNDRTFDMTKLQHLVASSMRAKRRHAVKKMSTAIATLIDRQ